MPSCPASFFSRDQLKLKVSVHTRNAAKPFSERPFAITCHHLRIHDTTRKPFLEYCISCFSQNTIQKMKNIQLFLDVFVLVLFVLFIFAGPARICDVTMSQTWIYSWCVRKAVFFNFFIYFRSFRSFRWFRFGRFVSLFRVLVHALAVNIPTSHKKTGVTEDGRLEDET